MENKSVYRGFDSGKPDQIEDALEAIEDSSLDVEDVIDIYSSREMKIARNNLSLAESLYISSDMRETDLVEKFENGFTIDDIKSIDVEAQFEAYLNMVGETYERAMRVAKVNEYLRDQKLGRKDFNHEINLDKTEYRLGDALEILDEIRYDIWGLD